jgi:protein phosphatase
VLVNAVGGSAASVRVDLHSVELRAGDALLLCSDGLSSHVPDDALAEHLLHPIPVERTVRALIDAANAAGGSDNITVVLARF